MPAPTQPQRVPSWSPTLHIRTLSSDYAACREQRTHVLLPFPAQLFFLSGNCIIFQLLTFLLPLISSLFLSVDSEVSELVSASFSCRGNHSQFLVTAWCPVSLGDLCSPSPWGIPLALCCLPPSPVSSVPCPPLLGHACKVSPPAPSRGKVHRRLFGDRIF